MVNGLTYLSNCDSLTFGRGFQCVIDLIIYSRVFLQQPFVLLGFCVCSNRRFYLGHLYIGRALIRHFIIDGATIFNGFSISNASVKTFFYVVIVMLSRINNLIYLPSTGYCEDFVLFNGASHFFYGFKICCLEQWSL